MGLKFRGTDAQRKAYYAKLTTLDNLQNKQAKEKNDLVWIKRVKNYDNEPLGYEPYLNESRFIKFDNTNVEKYENRIKKRDMKIDRLDKETTAEMKKIYYYEDAKGVTTEI